MTNKDIQRLASKYLNGTATKEEEQRLHAWYEAQEKDCEEIVVKGDGKNGGAVKGRLWRDIQSRLRDEYPVKTMPNRKKRVWIYAASILFFLSFSAIYSLLNETSPTVHYTKVLKNDVSPGGNNAVLEFGDSEKINLDDAQIGNLVSVDGLIATKTADGVVSFEFSPSSTKITNGFHTVRTPNGGQYRIKLPDNTEVWLNASSSITFPTVFSEDAREIIVAGEVYMEVAQVVNKQKQRVPFLVKSRLQTIEVLGTRFTVNSYLNEEVITTTLLEGSVRISPVAHPSARQYLKPGQRATLENGKVEIEPADLEEAMAWKNGDFIFNNESLGSIMRKIERWYDVKVIYQDYSQSLNQKYSGAVSRSKNLSAVLKIMELTNKVKFKIDGRRIYVMS